MLKGIINGSQTISGQISGRKYHVVGVINSSGKSMTVTLNKLYELRGYSAYDAAVINGFEGTEEEWLASLKGRDGIDGKDGADGKDGIDGERGSLVFNGLLYRPDSYSASLITGSKYRTTISNVLRLSSAKKVIFGDSALYENYLYPVIHADSTYVYFAERIYLVGPEGPEGPAGADGKNGKDGKDGYTPIKNVDYFDGADGKDGKDGYTPIKGVDYFDGEDGLNGKDGVNGKDGADGYTPVKGKDYWTSADKAEMVNDVISALPKYNGEVVDV